MRRHYQGEKYCKAKQKKIVQELVMNGKQVQDDHLMRQEDIVSLLLDDKQIAHK
jgi:DNA helicase INO80